MNPKILVVDDEPDIVKLVKTRLEYSQYEVIIAYDGQEALDKARHEKPALIILDIMLPKINGYDVASILKADINTRDIPIVMFTSLNQSKDIKKGMECGAGGFLNKQFNSTALLGLIPPLINATKKK